MKKTLITLTIAFLVCFTAFGQSVTLTPTNVQQNMIYYGMNPALVAQRANGTSASPTALAADNTMLFLGCVGYNGTQFPSGSNAAIRFKTSQTFSPTANGTYISFFTTANNTTSLLESMRIENNGNVGIGTATPNGNLSFGNVNNNRKILLYEDANNDHQFLGFGVNSQTLRYQIPSTTNSHVFYVGTSPTTSTELMRITGTGKVGIGTTTPTAKLEVNGFTKLGTDAPAIKVKKYLSTTALTQGGTATIAHGLTYAKIISATVLVESIQGKLFPPNITRTGNLEYDYDLDGTNIYVTNRPANSANILNQRLIIMITYEE